MGFPPAGARIYRNEAGEPVDWDNPAYDEPDYDPYEDIPYGDPFDWEDEPECGTPQAHENGCCTCDPEDE